MSYKDDATKSRAGKLAHYADGGPVIKPGEDGVLRVVDPRTGQVRWSGSSSVSAEQARQQILRQQRLRD